MGGKSGEGGVNGFGCLRCECDGGEGILLQMRLETVMQMMLVVVS